MGQIDQFTLEFVQLRKSFGTNHVLKGVDLTIGSGEFVGLMGPNGAGKSTLLKILAGVYTASSGEILLGGKVVSSLAGRTDVGFIHQDLGLVEGLTIAENLTLGLPPRRLLGPILNRRAESEEARKALALVGLDLHPDTPLSDLTAGEKTLVAVARVFDRGARILVVDETTSTLPPSEAKRVTDSLREAAAGGATVIMVTHKLSEILDATNRVLVIIDGELVGDAPTVDLDRSALVHMLRQNEVANSDLDVSDFGTAELLIELHDVYVGKAGPVDMHINSGEIVGISGLPGSGLHDLALAAAGVTAPMSGRIELARSDLKRGLVPPHRETQGGFGNLSVRENMSLAALRRWRSRGLLLDKRREREDCAAVMDELAVKPNSLDTPLEILSGGNKQKVIFGRALLNSPDLYVLCEPTRGVDVGTRSEIYRLIRRLAKEGAGVLIASSDAEDLFSVCQRTALITDGVLQPFRAMADLTETDLEMMV